jgi:hypothetical protein
MHIGAGDAESDVTKGGGKINKPRNSLKKRIRMRYSALQKKYGGQYVAYLKNRIVANGRTFGAVFKKVMAKGYLPDPDLSFRYIHPEDGICVYCM